MLQPAYKYNDVWCRCILTTTSIFNTAQMTCPFSDKNMMLYYWPDSVSRIGIPHSHDKIQTEDCEVVKTAKSLLVSVKMLERPKGSEWPRRGIEKRPTLSERPRRSCNMRTGAKVSRCLCNSRSSCCPLFCVADGAVLGCGLAR